MDKGIDVYVRNGGRQRTLSFNRISELSQGAALRAGLAIDGNSYTLTVMADVQDRDGDLEVLGGPWPGAPRDKDDSSIGGPAVARPLSEVLRDTELWLSKWLEELGYDVTFE